MKSSIIYLDNNSTTKLDPTVLEFVMPYYKDFYGNPSSNHELGQISSDGIKNAKKQIANLLDVNENELIFTSGATESINLALKGIVSANTKIKNSHIITCSTEHPAILDTCKFLELNGVRVTLIQVDENGLINLDSLKSAICEDTILISIMMVNNETGVIQPIREISDIAHVNNIPFMTDATQAVGKMKFSAKELGIDILCFSGHKFYAPKGVGGIYLNSKKPFRIKLPPILHGGGHQGGIRSGTLNVPGIIGLGMAAEIFYNNAKKEIEKITKLRDLLEKSLLEVENSFLNGSKLSRIGNTTNICFEGADADAIMVGLKNIFVSNGSACSSESIEPSHVLKAMGRTDLQAFSSIRFSVGRFNSEEEIIETISKVKEVVNKLRKMNK